MKTNNIIATLSSRYCKVIFKESSGGSPTAFVLADGQIAAENSGSELQIRLADGRCIAPVTAGAQYFFSEKENSQILEFTDLPFADSDGNAVADFHLSLRHELFADGAFFTTVMFHAETSEPPQIRDFTLTKKLSGAGFADIKGIVFPRKGNFSSTDIQSVTSRQVINRGETLDLGCNQLTNAGFYCVKESGESSYREFFLEGGNTLSGNIADGGSTITWQEGSPAVVWNFQKNPTPELHRPFSWRNRYGARIVPPPRERHLPPQQIYQYIDNYKHYPDDDELQAVIDSGCSMFVFHSNWRRDAKNGGVPYHAARFKTLVDKLHQHNIRVLLYTRGNEREIVEESAAWFDNCLQRDFDGLYIDYAGALAHNQVPDEDYPGGMTPFYRYYRNFARLREKVGANGVLILHTGAEFCNLAMGLADGYISGEAERGALIKSRAEYLFHTLAPAVTGTLWSAAFPEYSSRKIIPFIASAGQAPHSPLGIQFKSSSLAHPPVPGINDAVYRPLWRLWEIFRDKKDLRIFTDYNSGGVFSADGYGHYLMIAPEGDSALLIVSSFGAGEEEIKVEWQKCGFDPRGKKCFFLAPQTDSPGTAEIRVPEKLTVSFGEYPAVAFYFGSDEAKIAAFARPYPAETPQIAAYSALLDRERKLRCRKASEKNIIRIYVDNSICTSLENSNFFDLFDNRLFLVEKLSGDTFNTLGEIGRTKFYPAGSEAPESDLLRPRETSSAIDLNKILAPGRHQLAVYSEHGGIPFYSLINVLICDAQSGNDSDTLTFRNEIDHNRAFLSWECEIL